VTELCLHFPINLHGVMLNKLSTGTTLRLSVANGNTKSQRYNIVRLKGLGQLENLMTSS
jgi:hypothetical protein